MPGLQHPAATGTSGAPTRQEPPDTVKRLHGKECDAKLARELPSRIGMPDSASEIVIVDRRLAASELARLVNLFFGDMVKYVVDVERRIAAVGGHPPGGGESEYGHRGQRGP